MADRNLTFRISAQDDTSATFSKIAQASKREMGKVQKDQDDTASNGKRLAAVLEAMADELGDEFRKTEVAAERLTDALGPELAAKVNPEQLIGDFRRAGLTFEEIEADADALADSIKRIDDVSERAGIAMDSGLGKGEQALRRTHDAADQSRSVLANMAGNATSELPGIAGALGPVNVALGQLAEYAADGNIRLRNLIGLGAGMAALGVGISVVNKHFENIAKSDAFSKDKIDNWIDAMRDGASLAEAMAESFSDAGKVEVELGDDVVDLTPHLQRLGLTIDDFTRLTSMSQDELQAWADAMARAGVDAGSLAIVANGAAAEADDMADAQSGAAASAAVFGDSVSDAGDSAAGAGPNLDLFARATERATEASDAAADALARANDELSDLLDISDSLPVIQDNLAESLRNAADEAAGLAEQNASGEERYSSFLGIIEDGAGSLDEFIQVLREQGATSEEAAAQASGYLDQLFDLSEQFGITQEDADALRQQLGLDFPSIQARVDSVQVQEAILFYNELEQAAREAAEQMAFARAQNEAFIRNSPGLDPAFYLRNTPYPRAAGGAVFPGSTYRVGEFGEEVFQPNVAGTILPNGQPGTPNLLTDAELKRQRMELKEQTAHLAAIARAVTGGRQRMSYR